MNAQTKYVDVEEILFQQKMQKLCNELEQIGETAKSNEFVSLRWTKRVCSKFFSFFKHKTWQRYLVSKQLIDPLRKLITWLRTIAREKCSIRIVDGAELPCICSKRIMPVVRRYEELKSFL